MSVIADDGQPASAVKRPLLKNGHHRPVKSGRTGIHPIRPILGSVARLGFGAKPEAADFNMGFRSAPKTVIHATAQVDPSGSSVGANDLEGTLMASRDKVCVFS
jgi:hypothetical protein